MIDTENFDKLSNKEYKEQTKKNWTEAPCESHYSSKEVLTKEYFDEIEAHRYSTHPFIINNIKKFDIHNKEVLEIGFGMGTDHLSLARKGGIMHGIDLTPKNLDVTKKRSELYNQQSNLVIGDAENLPYENNKFDFVYSFGVIHHSPDTVKIIAEIYRVLKPGGECWITVYHKNSLFFLWSVFFCDWLLKGGFKKETIKERISRVEYPNNNPNLVTRLYKKSDFKNMFSTFNSVQASIDHLRKDHIAYWGKYIPQKLLDFLGKYFGWYVIVKAKK